MKQPAFFVNALLIVSYLTSKMCSRRKKKERICSKIEKAINNNDYKVKRVLLCKYKYLGKIEFDLE